MIPKISRYTVLMMVVVIFLLQGCRSSLKVEKGFNNLQGPKLTKVVSISPDFEVITSTARDNPRHFQFYKKAEEDFLAAIHENADRLSIEIEVINETKSLNVNSDFYNTLAPLKQEILNAAYMQEFQGGNKNSRLNGIYQFKKKPIISSAYSYLAKEYATNYFAVQGINIHKKPRTSNFLLVILFPPLGLYNLAHIETDLYYYNIVADVSKGEIVHKELRKVAQSINKSTINAMIYDSFKLMIK